MTKKTIGDIVALIEPDKLTCRAIIRVMDQNKADINEAMEDHKKLVREADVIMNGDNAAEQASLCDIVAQLKNEWPRENVHRIDAAMSLLRVAEKTDHHKVQPASLRHQVIQSVVDGRGDNGKGDEYIYADVYEQLSAMIAPYVNELKLPGSVVESVEFLLQQWVKAK